jgi:hypothetical protein
LAAADPRNRELHNSGGLAIFTAIRRASSRASGFVFSFEHLAARLKNPHYG